MKRKTYPNLVKISELEHYDGILKEMVIVLPNINPEPELQESLTRIISNIKNKSVDNQAEINRLR